VRISWLSTRHDGAVLDLIERHLPLDIVPHPLARSLVEALLIQRRNRR
jgi:hypothetical protein